MDNNLNLFDKVSLTKSLIQKNEIEKAIDVLDSLQLDEEYEKELLLISKKFYSLKSDSRKGILVYQDISVSESVVANNLIELCNQIIKKENRGSQRKSNQYKFLLSKAISILAIFAACSIIFIIFHQKKNEEITVTDTLSIDSLYIKHGKIINAFIVNSYLATLNSLSDSSSSLDTFLALYPNSLTGEIPNFDSLKSLPGLKLASNSLEGEIPNFDSLNNESLSYSNSLVTNLNTIEKIRVQDPTITLKEGISSNLSPLEYYNLGKTYLESDIDNLALLNLNKAIIDSVYFFDAYYYRGMVHRKLKNYEKSIEDYNRAESIYSSAPQLYINRSIVFYLLGELEQAEKDCEKAIMLDDRIPEAYNSLGNIYLMLGKYEKAMSNFELALEIKPLYSHAHYGVGITYLVTGDNEKMCKHIKKYLKITGKKDIELESNLICDKI